MRVMLSNPSLNHGQWVMLLVALAQKKGGEKLQVCHSIMRILKAPFCMLIIICIFSALLKQQGVDLKGAAKSTTPVNEEVPPLLEGGGKLEVALINISFL